MAHLDDTRMNEIVELLKELHEQEEDKKDAMGTFATRIRDAKNTIVQWAKDNDVPPGDIMNIYKTFKSAKDGQITWTEEDSSYPDLLFALIEKAIR